MKIILFIFYMFLVPLLSFDNSYQLDIKPNLPSNPIRPPSKSLNSTSTIISSDSLPSQKKLFQSLHTYYEQKTAAEVAEFQETEKGEWLKYLPNLGVTYTFDNKPRPAASISSSTIYSAKKSKQARAAKRKSIKQVNQLAHYQDKIKLQQLLNQHQLEIEALTFQTEIFEIDQILFEIEEAKYKNLEKPPSEYLKIKRAYLVKGFELREQRNRLSILLGEILVIARVSTQ